MGAFEDFQASSESYWRAIILFDQNVASYKFALGQSLLDLAAIGQTSISLDDLAVPFAKRTRVFRFSEPVSGPGPSGNLSANIRRVP